MWHIALRGCSQRKYGLGFGRRDIFTAFTYCVCRSNSGDIPRSSHRPADTPSECDHCRAAATPLRNRQPVSPSPWKRDSKPLLTNIRPQEQLDGFFRLRFAPLELVRLSPPLNPPKAQPAPRSARRRPRDQQRSRRRGLHTYPPNKTVAQELKRRKIQKPLIYPEQLKLRSLRPPGLKNNLANILEANSPSEGSPSAHAPTFEKKWGLPKSPCSAVPVPGRGSIDPI